MKINFLTGNPDFPFLFHGISIENSWNYFHSTNSLGVSWNGKQVAIILNPINYG
jgi:hypothetical protein